MTFQEPRTVLSDDEDIDGVGGYRLSICMGGNGDWYVSVLKPEERFGPYVRLRTSGGANSDFPGLCLAIASAYRALDPGAREIDRDEFLASRSSQSDRDGEDGA